MKKLPDNDVLDESVLMAARAVIGKRNTFYPGVVIECAEDARLTIGDDNVFYPGTYIVATRGEVSIGSGNEFGPAGCVIRANTPDARITIGDGGRYSGGVQIMGTTSLGSGSQVLGTITVQGCDLAAGGDYQAPDPDQRASVLKGSGLARSLVLHVGQVVNGNGNFADAPIEQQSAYHPKAAK